jgi:hypothetical protein
VVLSDNPLAVSPRKLHCIKIVQTIKEGKEMMSSTTLEDDDLKGDQELEDCGASPN